ncbi:hypothetical protein AJ878_01555 [Campylobacter jejuni]|nr:3-deoxy-manno-octulosonate cytidylyltransferase [Campylobacter coli]OEW32811.1 hypothetical protein AJ878_01555 [Campylobacter jejuni]
MKILGVIPARYGSTRFPGKPLVDILGKPMIWWVYQQAKRAKKLTNLIVATDDERISRVCDKFDIPLMMTREQPNCFHRLHKVSLSIKADKYLLINGDEPLMEREVIQEMINEVILKNPYHLIAYRSFDDPVGVIDNRNIKITLSGDKIVYLSRSPIPYPHKSINFEYNKIIGLQALSKEALEFFVNTQEGFLEKIEDIAELRWVKNHKITNCKKVNSRSIAVDNPKDLAIVKSILQEKLKNEELNYTKEIL